jgi:hypothetical protein
LSGGTLILFEAILVIGAVFGFGAWQLWSLRRDRQRDGRTRRDREPRP